MRRLSGATTTVAPERRRTMRDPFAPIHCKLPISRSPDQLGWWRRTTESARRPQPERTSDRTTEGLDG